MAFDDLYAVGMAASPDYLGGDNNREDSDNEVGVGSARDAAVEAQLLKSQIKQLNAAMVEFEKTHPDKKLPDSFTTGFYAFVEQFDGWTKRESERNRLAQWLSDDTWRAAQMYKEQFLGFANEFTRLTDVVIKPDPRPAIRTNVTPSGKGGKGTSVWTYVLGGVALVAAGWAGYKFAQEGLHSYKRKLGVR